MVLGASRLRLARRLGAVACLFVLAGCTGQDDHPKASGDDRFGQMIASGAEVQRQAQEIHDVLVGTVVQQAAVQYLMAYKQNYATATCMIAKGFDWDPTSRISVAPGVLDAFGESTWLREPLRPIASPQVILNATALRNEQEAMQVVLPSDENAAVDACLRAQRGDQKVDPGLRPYLRGPRGTSFFRPLYGAYHTVDLQLGPPEKFTECMKAAGTPVGEFEGEFSEGIDSLRAELLAELAPDADNVPVGDEPETKAWQEFLAVEHADLVDDATCREGEYEEGMALLRPVVESFARDHGADLAKVEQHWKRVEAKAASLGFVPTQDQLEASSR